METLIKDNVNTYVWQRDLASFPCSFKKSESLGTWLSEVSTGETQLISDKGAKKAPNLKQVQRTQQIFLTVLLYTQPTTATKDTKDKNDIFANLLLN